MKKFSKEEPQYARVEIRNNKNICTASSHKSLFELNEEGRKNYPVPTFFASFMQTVKN
jgi:hypothetical protein